MDYKERVKRGCGDVVLTDKGCWIWVQSLRNGYGQFNDKGRVLYAHRTSYQAFNGPIPAGKLICHKCHNRRCVNPSHLYVGDKRTNAIDMLANGDGKNQTGKYGKIFKITNGVTTLNIKNQNEFCRKNGLNRGNFGAMLKGIRNHCQGWRLAK